MGCDMLVALPRATLDGGTLFGHNCNRPGGEELILLRAAGRVFAPGENVQTGAVALPQVRRTWTVLASRCPGQWGYEHGLNEHGVSVGFTAIRTKPWEGTPALTGPDLVRLALERASSARQALDVMTDLVRRHGQGSADAELHPAFLIADGREAFVVEMFGPHWAVQHVGAVRAVSDVCHLRQDWDHLAHGLADLAIARGWWPANGSKLDFAGSVGHEGGDNAAALRRWGRATLLLEQSSGQIDVAMLRQVLSDHFEGCAGAASADQTAAARAGSSRTLCRHAATPSALRTAASLIAQTGPDPLLPIAWYSFGPPCDSVYFPLLLAGELPAKWQSATGGPHGWRRHGPTDEPDQPGRRAALSRLQERFDRETREFVTEAAELRHRGELDLLPRLAELFMQHTVECWENTCLEFAPAPTRAARAPAESEFHSSGAWS